MMKAIAKNDSGKRTIDNHQSGVETLVHLTGAPAVGAILPLRIGRESTLNRT